MRDVHRQGRGALQTTSDGKPRYDRFDDTRDEIAERQSHSMKPMSRSHSHLAQASEKALSIPIDKPRCAQTRPAKARFSHYGRVLGGAQHQHLKISNFPPRKKKFREHHHHHPLLQPPASSPTPQPRRIAPRHSSTMAPKEPYKVHSLNKHVEDTKKGLSGSAQYNRRPIAKAAAAAVKNEPGALNAAVFGNNNDSDESSDSSESDSDSDGETGADLLKKLGANGATPSTGPKRRGKVDEIADSDIERTASAKRAAAKKEQLAKKESSTSETSSDSSSESESEQDEPKAKANGAVAAPQAAAGEESSSSSSEDESEDGDEESDGEEEEEPKAEPKPAAKQAATPAKPAATNGTAKAAAAAADSSSSSEESSEDEDEPAKPQPTKAQPTKAQSTKAQATKAQTAKVTSAKAQPAKEVTEESSSDSEDSDAQADESMGLSDRETETQVAVPNFIAPDFTLRKGDDGANGQDVARICNEANLQGKQFWYFTVPSNVPVSVIENIEIPMDRSQLGSRVFSHDGQDYGVSFDTISTRSSIQILIPSSSDSNYQPGQ